MLWAQWAFLLSIHAGELPFPYQIEPGFTECLYRVLRLGGAVCGDRLTYKPSGANYRLGSTYPTGDIVSKGTSLQCDGFVRKYPEGIRRNQVGNAGRPEVGVLAWVRFESDPATHTRFYTITLMIADKYYEYTLPGLRPGYRGTYGLLMPNSQVPGFSNFKDQRHFLTARLEAAHPKITLNHGFDVSMFPADEFGPMKSLLPKAKTYTLHAASNVVQPRILDSPPNLKLKILNRPRFSDILTKTYDASDKASLFDLRAAKLACAFETGRYQEIFLSETEAAAFRNLVSKIQTIIPKVVQPSDVN